MSDQGPPQSDADARARLELAAVAGLVGVIAAIVFVGWPGIDMAVSRLFNLGPRQFWLNGSDLADDLRSLFTLLTWMAGIAAVVGLVLAIATRRHLFGFGLPQWLFLVLVVTLGPGLIANSVLKDNWERPRPLHIVEFGGPNQFTPVLERSGQCDHNCSFVSGEASSVFALGFALAMLVRRRRAILMGATLGAGALIGFIRIGEGGHFLSDVVFAGVFMALTVALLHWVVFGLLGARLRDEARWHDLAVAATGAFRRQASRILTHSSEWIRRHRARGERFAATSRARPGDDGEDPPSES